MLDEFRFRYSSQRVRRRQLVRQWVVHQVIKRQVTNRHRLAAKLSRRFRTPPTVPNEVADAHHLLNPNRRARMPMH